MTDSIPKIAGERFKTLFDVNACCAGIAEDSRARIEAVKAGTDDEERIAFLLLLLALDDEILGQLTTENEAIAGWLAGLEDGGGRLPMALMQDIRTGVRERMLRRGINLFDLISSRYPAAAEFGMNSAGGFPDDEAPAAVAAVIAAILDNGARGVPLSDAVANAVTQADSNVVGAIARGAVVGRPLREMLPEIRDALTVTAKERLLTTAMTELNGVYNKAVIETGRRQPVAAGQKLVFDWVLSANHPRRDICDEFAGGSPYEPEAEALTFFQPHPRCLCSLQPRLVPA